MSDAALPAVGTYLRHGKTADLARVVMHEGKLMIKPDLPGSPVYYPITRLHEFNIEVAPKKLPPGSWARVSYDADRALCDLHPELRRQPEWNSVHPMTKAAWIEGRVKFDQSNPANLLRLELNNVIRQFFDERL